MITARSITSVLGLFVLAALPVLTRAQQPANPMSFFITSVGSGRGANFGGSWARTSTVRHWPLRRTQVTRAGRPI